MMTGPGNNRRLAPIDFKAMKADVSILDVLRLMNWEPNAQRKDELRGPCPVHKSKSPTSKIFSVSPEKNAFKCFSCDAGGNILDLAAHHFGIESSQVVRVAVKLCRELGREIPRKE